MVKNKKVMVMITLEENALDSLSESNILSRTTYQLASMGTLIEVTKRLKMEAAKAHKVGLFSLKRYNQKLVSGK